MLWGIARYMTRMGLWALGWAGGDTTRKEPGVTMAPCQTCLCVNYHPPHARTERKKRKEERPLTIDGCGGREAGLCLRGWQGARAKADDDGPFKHTTPLAFPSTLAPIPSVSLPFLAPLPPRLMSLSIPSPPLAATVSRWLLFLPPTFPPDTWPETRNTTSLI